LKAKLAKGEICRIYVGYEGFQTFASIFKSSQIGIPPTVPIGQSKKTLRRIISMLII
jgi:hypothetical protein